MSHINTTFKHFKVLDMRMSRAATIILPRVIELDIFCWGSLYHDANESHVLMQCFVVLLFVNYIFVNNSQWLMQLYELKIPPHVKLMNERSFMCYRNEKLLSCLVIIHEGAVYLFHVPRKKRNFISRVRLIVLALCRGLSYLDNFLALWTIIHMPHCVRVLGKGR